MVKKNSTTMAYLVGCAIVGVKLSILCVLHGSSGYESIWIEFPKFLLGDKFEENPI